MVKNNFNHSNDLSRFSSRFPDQDPGKTARRLFGADFLFVIFFLVIAFYFFWPKLFQTPGQYVPETTLNEILLHWEQIQKISKENIAQNKPDSDIVKAIQTVCSDDKQENKVQLFLLDGEQQWLLGEANKPAEWSLFLKNRSPQPLGCWIYSQQGKATFYFWGQIEPLGWTAVLVQPFPALFKE